MDGFRCGRLDPSFDLAPVRQRDAQARIGRDLDRWKAVWRQEFEFGPKRRSGTGERSQCANDAVDLRVPGISRNEYPHDENLRVR